MEEVCQLLQTCFQSTGEGATEQIMAATSTIEEQLASESSAEFYTILLQIAENVQINMAIRKAALSVIMHGHRNYNETFAFDTILEDLPNLLMAQNDDLRGLISAILKMIVPDSVYSGRIQNPLDFFNAVVQSNTVAALIFAKSLLKSPSMVEEEKCQIFAVITSNLLPILTEILMQSTSYLECGLCLSCGCKATIDFVAPEFTDPNGMIINWIQKAITAKEVSEDVNYNYFARKAIKFCSQVLYRTENWHNDFTIRPDDAYDIFDLLADLVTYQNPPKTQSALATLLDVAFVQRYTADMMMQQMDTVLQYVVMPFFTLTEEEIAFSRDNDYASNFVNSVLTNATNDSDPRGYIFGKIRRKWCANLTVRQCFCESVNNILTTALQAFAEATERPDELTCTVFSALYLFASVGAHFPALSEEHTQAILEALVALCSDDDPLMKSGALFAINSLNIILPGELLEGITQILLGDESALVRYFAALLFSNSVKLIPNNEEGEALKTQIAPELGNILSGFVTLAEIFDDNDFLYGMKRFIEAFAPYLAGDGETVASTLLEIYTATFNPQNQKNEYASLSALAVLVPFLDEETKVSVLTELTRIMCEGSISNGSLDVIANILAASPSIVEDHWQAVSGISTIVAQGTEFIQPYSLLESAVIVYNNLLYKDRAEVCANEEHWGFAIQLMAQLLEAAQESGEDNILCSSVSYAVAVVNVGGQNFPTESIPPLLQLIDENFERPRFTSCLSKLYAALLIATQLSIAGEGNLLERFVQNSMLPELLAVVATFGVNMGEALIPLCQKGLELLNELHTFTEEEQNIETESLDIIVNVLSGYELTTLIDQFGALLGSLPEEQRAALQEGFPEKPINEIVTGGKTILDVKSAIRVNI